MSDKSIKKLCKGRFRNKGFAKYKIETDERI
jgi:hypothetical protein